MDMPAPGSAQPTAFSASHPDGQITVFAEHLYAVFGLALSSTASSMCITRPKFTVFTDDNGVGKDRGRSGHSDNPEPVGRGGFNDHIPSNIRLAMDNYLYMSTGDKGIFGAKSNVDGPTAEIHGGGILRSAPDGTDWKSTPPARAIISTWRSTPKMKSSPTTTPTTAGAGGRATPTWSTAATTAIPTTTARRRQSPTGHGRIATHGQALLALDPLADRRIRRRLAVRRGGI